MLWQVLSKNFIFTLYISIDIEIPGKSAHLTQKFSSVKSSQ